MLTQLVLVGGEDKSRALLLSMECIHEYIMHIIICIQIKLC